MNGSTSAAVRNTVRPPGAPFARPRAALSRKVTINRESNALRASVFDVAMQIGLGANGAVTDWVYNNSVSEEEEFISSSSLTTGSSSTSSARFPYSPPSSSRSIASSSRSLLSSQRPFSPGSLTTLEESSSIAEGDTETLSNTTTTSITFSNNTMPLPSISVRLPAKLKKRRADGYESDAGYVSDGKGKKKKDKKGKPKTGINASVPIGSENDWSNPRVEQARTEEENENEKEAAQQKVNSLISQWGEKAAKANASAISKGYETDAPARRRFGRKKKAGAHDVGYETDGGYISSGSPAPGSKKSKTKFFKLGGKSSKPELVENVSKEVSPLPLPIAQKFGTMLNNGATALPPLPLIPSLDVSLTTALPALKPHPSPSPVLAPPSTAADPMPRSRSEILNKDASSEKGPRDSHVSGESSRSSTSYASTGLSSEAKAPRRNGLRFLPSAKSSPNLSSSKVPVISLPLTRTPPPAQPDTNTNSVVQNHNNSELPSSDVLRPPSSPIRNGNNGQETRGQYSSPAPSAFLSPSSRQRPVLPALITPNSPPVSTSPTSVPSPPAISLVPSFIKPRNSILSVNSALSHSSKSLRRFSRGRSPSPVPSSDWILPSPSTTSATPPVSSPTQYDLSPLGPPPNVPLPNLPDPPKSDVEDDPFGVNSTSVIRSFSHMERGKDLSFIARLRNRASSNNEAKMADGVSRRISKQQISAPRSVVDRATDSHKSGSPNGQESDHDDISGQEIQDLLDRFTQPSNHRNDRETGGKALGRRRSFEALLTPRPDGLLEIDVDEDESFQSEEYSRKRRSTIYYSDMISEYLDEEDGADPRLSRWSGSVYSRASLMDGQRSEETRTRFVKRVEAMLDEAGIERGNKRDWDAVPPVPKLPEALAQRNHLMRQNQLMGAGPTSVNGWV